MDLRLPKATRTHITTESRTLIVTQTEMSLRPTAPPAPAKSAPKTFDLPIPEPNVSSPAAADEPLAWKDLSEVEKSAASLGVDPSAWKPIAFMNEAHYNTLLKANAIDADLAKKLEAYKVVASAK